MRSNRNPLRLNPQTFFVTDETLDFTLVAVEPQNEEQEQLAAQGWCPLIPGSGKAIVGERVNIVQHPAGERLQVTVRENTIVAVAGDFLQYEADTQPGSSGSPVFNEQWEMAALHHAGVPKRDNQGRILMKGGIPWTGRREDVDKIIWKSNEGTRISRIVAHVENETLSAAERSLWQQVFIPPPAFSLWEMFREAPLEVFPGPVRPHPNSSASADNGEASWLFKLSFGPTGTSLPGSTPRKPIPVPSRVAPPQHRISHPPAISHQPTTAQSELVDQMLERFRHTGPYYDSEEDRVSAEAYWSGVEMDLAAEGLFHQLQNHLEQTHIRQHSYARARHQFLYPAVDLRPNGQLHNIYSGTALHPRDVIERELAEVRPRAEALNLEVNTVDIDALLDDEALWETIEAETLLEENATVFNCEHVVCQSWFDRRQPMKADLHHLFTCEPGCNSFRSNIPYYSFSPTEEAERDDCGKRVGNKFEPELGHGAVARATMYFLMRYPGEVGERRSELTRSRIGVLLKWHEADDISEYERHRNWLIEKAQGNRNPFIDHPDIATRALLAFGFARN